jgi:hypothetical protein
MVSRAQAAMKPGRGAVATWCISRSFERRPQPFDLSAEFVALAF